MVCRPVDEPKHPVAVEINDWLRPYQLDFINDFAQFRIYLKGRQIGISDVVALESVLTAAGLLSPDVVCHNVNMISRREREAKELIRDCKKWVRILRQDPELEKWLETETWSATEIRFVKSRRYVRSETQSPDAAVGGRGHLVLDEFALQAFAREIWSGALPLISSMEGLRVTIISTPRPRTLFEEIWEDHDRYHFFSRHRTDAIEASEQGHPINIELMRGACATEEQWRQEFMCEFLSTGEVYFDRPLMLSARAPRPSNALLLGKYVGIDIASIVDNTAVQVLEHYDEPTASDDTGLWYGETFVIGAGTRYESNLSIGHVGQDILCDALIRYSGAVRTVCDASSEGAILSAYLIARKSCPEIVPHIVSRRWKNDYVPALKGAVERGFVHFTQFTYRLYSQKRAMDFVVNGRIPDEALADFVAVCFSRREFSMLLNDFGRVHKTFTQEGTSFDTTRDREGAGGHGDTFWGSVFALYGWAMGRPASGLTRTSETGKPLTGTDHSEYH